MKTYSIRCNSALSERDMFFESFLLNLTVVIVLIVALIFDYVTKFFSYWYIRHVQYKTPIPFFGSDYHRVFGLRNTTQEINKLSSQNSGEKFIGCLKSRIPDLIVRDVDAVHKILLTDFANFPSRGLDLDKSRDICLRNNLFYTEGENWTLLHEGFESILKSLSPPSVDIRDCLQGTNGETNVQCLLTNVLDAVFKNLLTASNDEEAVLIRIRSGIQTRNLMNRFKSYIKNIFPSLYKSFGLMTLPGEPSKKALQVLKKSKLINDVRKIRSILQTQKEEQNDKKKKSYDSDVNFIFSVLTSFVSEGYIPCHNLLTSLLYELAMNTEVQKKLRNSNTSDKYMDQVIDETLRLHPPYSVITRKCVKSYKFQEDFLIDHGVTVNVPVELIHTDSSHYVDAGVFNPERFSCGENLKDKHAFLPFGAGPRKCVGEELSRQIFRTVTSAILKSFEIEPTVKTPSQLTMVDYNFGRVIDRDIWLRFTPVCP